MFRYQLAKGKNPDESYDDESDLSDSGFIDSEVNKEAYNQYKRNEPVSHLGITYGKKYSQTDYESLLDKAVNAALEDNLTQLCKCLASEYAVMKPQTHKWTDGDNFDMYFLYCHHYLTLQDNGAQLFAAAISGGAKNVIEYLLSQNELFSDKLIKSYIDRQVDLVYGVQNGDGTSAHLDYLDIILKHHDPKQYALLIFTEYFKHKVKDFSRDSYEKLSLLLNGLGVCMSKEDQMIFLHVAHDYINTPSIKSTIKKLDTPNPKFMENLSSYIEFLRIFSQYGFSIDLKSIDIHFKEHDPSKLGKHACLVKDIKDQYYFWGYAKDKWRAHKIDSAEIPMLIQGIFPNSKTQSEHYFVPCTSMFLTVLKPYHTPFLNKINKLDNKITEIAENYRTTLNTVMKDIMDALDKQAQKEVPKVMFFGKLAAHIFIKLCKNLNTNFEEMLEKLNRQLTLDERMRILVDTLKKAYGAHPHKSLYALMDKLYSSDVLVHQYSVSDLLDRNDIIKMENPHDARRCYDRAYKRWKYKKMNDIKFSARYEALIPFIDKSDAQCQPLGLGLTSASVYQIL